MPATVPSSTASVGGPDADGPRARWPLAYGVLTLVWGMSFVFIKVGVEVLAPVQVALARVAAGAATLAVVLAVTGQRWCRGWHLWGHLAVTAALANAAPYTLLAYGEQRIPSALAGIWNAATPLLTVPFAVALLADERPDRRRGSGLVVGFVGVLVVLGVWHGTGGGDLAGDGLCLAAAACYGLAYPYTRRYLAGRPESGPVLAAGQLLAGTVELAVAAPLLGGPPSSLPARVVLAVAALGILGTGVAYILNYAVVRAAGATTASTVTYVVPVWSTVAGVGLLGERLAWYQPVGAVVILAGAVLGGGTRRSRGPQGSRRRRGWRRGRR